ncbi:pilus assembly protein TadD, partial [Agrobacterium sp. BETTINA12B]|nr:pilus assembly protein TadD [Agrobacterium sp. BETTINA12B]
MSAASTTSLLKTFLFRGASAALLALALAGCSTTGKDKMTTGSIPTVSKPIDQMDSADLARATLTLGKAYDTNPKDRDTGVNYANVLRMTGRNEQALAVMQQVAINHPSDRGVLAAYGKAQAAAGQLQEALATIDRAQL